MAGLSLNWKSLQSKISPKAVGGSAKVVKKKKKVIKNVAANNAASGAVVVNTAAPTSGAIELVLWNKDRDITASDIPLTPQSLEPHGRNAKKQEPGRFVAMDCEFVGVGFEGKESALARVSIVNFYGHVLLDKFVKPKEKVVDWRTWVSGVTPKHMKDAITFEEAQKLTSDILGNRILVGHAIHHDLDSLFLSHPRSQIRDTSKFPPFRQIAAGKTPSLKKLALHFLKIDIQGAEHSSVEDARATMLLFRLNKKEFEQYIRLQQNGNANFRK